MTGTDRLDALLRVILPLYLLAYLGVAFVWRSYVVGRRIGSNPVVFGDSDNLHDFLGRVFKVALELLALMILVFALSPPIYQALAPIVWLEHWGLKTVGLLLLLVSFALTAVAQAQMGASWRIGIDRNHSTAFVRHGLFRRSRNPIFLGMIFTLLGLFLVIPNALTLAIMLVGLVAIQAQVRLEEEHLTKAHGETYLAYCRQVRRWL